tara:strand:+ start:2270 stop:3412 length:1143 start_codon:yes stop_codon:yes gene_type:complete
MKYCIKCLQPDTRPNIKFDDNGICPACNYYSHLGNIDWEERCETLINIVKEYKQNNKSNKKFHDCIIGVSGGKDSTRQALWIREKLGLNPLLVCLAYPPDQVNNLGANNLSNLIELGFDIHTVSLAPKTWKNLMLASFRKYTNWCRSTELALFAVVPRLAIRYEIPLILWGENPGLQLGDLKTLGKTGYDGNNIRNMNTLEGGGIDWMIKEGFLLKDLIGYQYPTPEEFDQAKLQIIYLGWFLGDWSYINNGMYSSLNGLGIKDDGLENGDPQGISALDTDWVSLNQMIKFLKFGFGNVTDYINEEIRLGRCSRDEAIKIVEQYDGICSAKYIESFCKYLAISTNDFWDQVYQSMNKKLFSINKNGEIKKRFDVGVGLYD